MNYLSPTTGIIILFVFLFILFKISGIVSAETYINGTCESNICGPLTGSEPVYEPSLWNDNNYIQGSHNCYTYSMNDINHDLAKLYEENKAIRSYINPQPGHHCGMTKRVQYKETTCEKLDERMKCDNPNVIDSTFEESCPSGYYKIFLATNPGKIYHYYRQGSTGYWDHKDGGKEATNIDASGNLITNPEIANRYYDKKNNFHDSCGFYCVPSNETDDTCVTRNDYYGGQLHYEAQCDRESGQYNSEN